MYSKIKILYKQLHFNLFLYLFLVKVFEKTLSIVLFVKHFTYKNSFSQGGEDIILNHLFKNKSNGFFIDIGCNHPIESNNTFNLYTKGWRGLNIDGNNSLINLYPKFRPNDISLCQIISDTEKFVTFYISKSNKVSTIDETFYKDNNNAFEYNSDDFIKLPSIRLDKILKNTDVDTKNIDLLTIDVEGHDINVLLSLDLNIIRPKVICIEDHQINIKELETSNIYNYLIEKRYKLKYYAISSCFYIDENYNV